MLRDPARLAALSRYPHRRRDAATRGLDRLAVLAARVLGTAAAAASLIDADRQLLLGVGGARAEVLPLYFPAADSLCRLVVESGGPVLLGDVRARAAEGPGIVLGDLEVLAYLGVPLHAPDGHVVGTMFAVDAAPRAWTEADAATLTDLAVLAADDFERQRFAALVEYGTELITLLDADGTIRYMSPAAQRVPGNAPAELIGQRAAAVVHPDDRVAVEAAIARLAAAGGETRVTYRFRGRGGAWRTYEATACSLLDVPAVSALVVNSRDITRRVRALAALEDAKARAERAWAAAEEARSLAEEMARLKSAFLANMSHEIRTPLTTIIGFADVLAAETPPSLAEPARLIHEGGQRLMDTLNSVLDLAQLESGALHLKVAAFDLADLARDVVRALRPMAAERGLTLLLDAPPYVAIVTDRGAVLRVLNNLLANALKFTRAGHVAVTLATDGPHAVLDVADTGVGIDPGFLPHVFDEFRQESTGLTRDFEGTGLGLTITRRLVELMQGHIEVTSEKGRGTRFRVTLPLVLREA